MPHSSAYMKAMIALTVATTPRTVAFLSHFGLRAISTLLYSLSTLHMLYATGAAATTVVFMSIMRCVRQHCRILLRLSTPGCSTRRTCSAACCCRLLLQSVVLGTVAWHALVRYI
jgi:hypothetical protein